MCRFKLREQNKVEKEKKMILVRVVKKKKKNLLVKKVTEFDNYNLRENRMK